MNKREAEAARALIEVLSASTDPDPIEVEAAHVRLIDALERDE